MGGALALRLRLTLLLLLACAARVEPQYCSEECGGDEDCFEVACISGCCCYSSTQCEDDSGCGTGQTCMNNCCTDCFDIGLGKGCLQCSSTDEDSKCTLCSPSWYGELCDQSSVVQRLANGGFETGNLASWSTGSSFFPFAYVLEQPSLSLSGTRYFSVAATAQLAFLSQTVTTAAGQPHQLYFGLLLLGNAPTGTLFVVQLQPAPREATTLAPKSFQEDAPALQPGSTSGSFNLTTTTLIEQWTLYQINFVPATASTTVRLGFRGRDGLASSMPQFVVDDVELISGDFPVIQAVAGGRNAAMLTVALVSPLSSATYYITAFSDAATTQPDGVEQLVSATSGNGTATDPFTFTWSYTAAATPPAQRWFVVEADPDGSGPGQRVASIKFGPVLVGAPQLSNAKGSSTTRASLDMASAAAAGFTRYTIRAQRDGNDTWATVLAAAAAGSNTFAVAKGRWRFQARAGTPSSWGDWSEATGYVTVGLPVAPEGFSVTSPAPGLLRVALTVTPEHLELGTRFFVRGLGATRRQVFPREAGPFNASILVAGGSYSVRIDAENDNLAPGAAPPTTVARAVTVGVDLPTIQTTRGSTNAATLFVALANPNPEAVYYIKAFKTAAIAQPDGGEQQVSATIGNGTAADPFTFTWRYSAAGTPPAQRWFVVEADADGSGPAKRAASTLSGPVTLGANGSHCDKWEFRPAGIACAACQPDWQGTNCDRTIVERLVNGDFQAGTLDRWVQAPNPLQASFLDETVDFEPVNRFLTARAESGMESISQTAPTVAGRPHLLSFSLEVEDTHASSLFAVQLQPAPIVPANVFAPQGDPSAPQLRPDSAPASFSLQPTDVFYTTRYQIQFAASAAQTTVRLSFRHPSGHFIVDDVSLASEDYPVIQSVQGARDSAALTVWLVSPQPGAAYYVKVFTGNTTGLLLEGEQRVSATSGSGTAASPFTFTWRYTAAGTPPAQRWLVVEVDPDSGGPGQRAAAPTIGPVLVGAPQLSNAKGSSTTRASLDMASAAAAGFTRYTIAAQRSGATTWSEVLNTTRAGTNSFNLSSTGRWRFRARAGTPSSWGDWSEATNLTVVGAPAAPGGFTASSPAAGVLSISFIVTAEHLSLLTSFSLRGVGSSPVPLSPQVVGTYTTNVSVAAGTYTLHIDASNVNLAKPVSAGPKQVTVAKLQSPDIVNIIGSSSGGPTLTFLRPANAGSATLAWSFTLLSSSGSQIGSSARPIAAASISGAGVAASPHKAVLSLPDEILRSGGLFRLRLTASLTTSGGTIDKATTAAASPEFGIGKPRAPTLTSVTGGEKGLTVVLTMPQTVSVAGVSIQAIRPTKFVLGLKSLLARNSQCTAELNVPTGSGPYTLTYQPATALPRDEWNVTVAARHSNGDSAAVQWRTAIVTGLPAAVTLGSVTPSGTGVSIRFTHAPRYSQGLQARVRVWNPIGPDGKPLAANKEVEETLPTPTNANAGVITPNGGALTLPAAVTNAYDVVVRIGSTAAQPILRPGRWRLSVALGNAVGFGPASAKTAVLEVGLPHRVAAPTLTGGRGQAAVRINQTRLQWPTATNPPTVREFRVLLERMVNNKVQLAVNTTVPAANAGKDVVFNSLAAGQYRASVTPCGANGCAAKASPVSAVVTVPATAKTGRRL